MTTGRSATLFLGGVMVTVLGCGNPDLESQTQALVPTGDFLTLVSPTNTLAFAAQDVGSASAGQQVTLANSGTLPLTFTSLSFTGQHPADFQFGPLGTCASGTVLQPGETCLLDVIFAPTAAGARSTRVHIVDSANRHTPMISR